MRDDVHHAKKDNGSDLLGDELLGYLAGTETRYYGIKMDQRAQRPSIRCCRHLCEHDVL